MAQQLVLKQSATTDAGMQLTTAAQPIYTCPANTRAEVRKITFTNVTSGAITVTAYRVASGGSAAANNTISIDHNIVAKDEWGCPPLVGHSLNAGGTIQALASANTSITVHITVLEYPA